MHCPLHDLGSFQATFLDTLGDQDVRDKSLWNGWTRERMLPLVNCLQRFAELEGDEGSKLCVRGQYSHVRKTSLSHECRLTCVS